MTLNTINPTWKQKVLVDETFVFGGDLGADPATPGSYSAGAYSVERAVALAATDVIELDFTFDAKANGDAISVGLSNLNPDFTGSTASIDASWEWSTTQLLIAREGSTQRYSSGSAIALPMSCRIIYNAGGLTFRSNAGADTLRYTSVRSVASILDIMKTGLSVKVSFFGPSGQVHVTLKAGDSDAPEVPGTSTGRIGDQFIELGATDLESQSLVIPRTLVAYNFPASSNPRPDVGKIWPRNR